MSRHPASGFLRVVLRALAFAGLLAAARAAEGPPAVVEGTLPNGLRYVVVPHASPRHDLALRLIVHAGSLDERDDERGFAHFVEHMAFNGTRTHPPGTVFRLFEQLGLTVGADLNARTSPSHTVYLLDLPAGQETALDTALGVLRDDADGLLFPPEEVAREASVVLSELRSRDGARQRLTVQFMSALYAGTAAPAREVSGEPAQIAHATPAQLRAFYERTYRADRLTLTVVGPVEPAAVVAKISAAFASLPPPPVAAPPPAVTPLPPPAATLPVECIVAPGTSALVVDLAAIQLRPPDDAAGRRTELLQRVAARAFQARLNATLEAGLAPFGAARIELGGGVTAALQHHQFEVQSAPGHGPEAIAFAETELRRLGTQGFLPSEIDEAVAALRTAARAEVATYGSQTAAQVSAGIEAALLAGRAWRPPAAEQAAVEAALDHATAAEVTAVARAMWAAPTLHLVVRSPEPFPGGAAAARSAYEQSTQVRLRLPVAPATALGFYYEKFGPAGAVVSRDRDAALAIERLAFANGVRLNLRPSVLEPGRFRLRVEFAQNAAAVPKNRPGLAELAGAVFTTAHTGKHLASELQRLLQVRGVTREFSVTDGVARCAFAGPAAELPFTLRLLTALLSDLKPDPVIFRQDLGRYAGYRTARLGDLNWRALHEALQAFSGGDARLSLPPADQVADYEFDEVQRWMDTWWLRGPLEVGVVGDFAVDAVIAEASTTLGALPPRLTPKPVKPLATPTRATRRTIAAHAPGGTATSCVLWPLPADDDPRINAAAALAADILRDRLRTQLREQLGATYAPATGLRRDRVQRDLAFAWMLNTFKPDEAERFTDRALAIAAELAQTGATAEEFTRLRAPAQTRAAEDLENNRWWLESVVAPAQSHPEVLVRARAHGTIFDLLTLAEVNRAAQLFAAPATVTILRPDRS